MSTPKSYIHDRVVLLLLTVSVFLAALGSLLILLKFDPGRNQGYIVQYRASLGISGYRVGSDYDLLGFVAFFAIILGLNVLLSIRVYNIHRQFALTVLSLGLLLLVLAIIVSNALLVLG